MKPNDLKALLDYINEYHNGNTLGLIELIDKVQLSLVLSADENTIDYRKSLVDELTYLGQAFQNTKILVNPNKDNWNDKKRHELDRHIKEWYENDTKPIVRHFDETIFLLLFLDHEKITKQELQQTGYFLKNLRDIFAGDPEPL